MTSFGGSSGRAGSAWWEESFLKKLERLRTTRGSLPTTSRRLTYDVHTHTQNISEMAPMMSYQLARVSLERTNARRKNRKDHLGGFRRFLHTRWQSLPNLDTRTETSETMSAILSAWVCPRIDVFFFCNLDFVYSFFARSNVLSRNADTQDYSIETLVFISFAENPPKDILKNHTYLIIGTPRFKKKHCVYNFNAP